MTCASDNHANFDHSQIEQKPKVIQIAIIERVFIIPFGFDCYTIAIIIYLVSWCQSVYSIRRNLDFELMFAPSSINSSQEKMESFMAS